MRLFSTEQVSKYHPDKYADQISDAILTAALRNNEKAHVAVETMVKDNVVVLGGEVSNAGWLDYEAIVHNVAHKLGYWVDKVINLIGQQSTEINNAVESEEAMGAGDQGIMFGYATNETESYLPYGFHLANQIIKAIEYDVDHNTATILKGDAKTQVTVDLDTNELHTVVVSVCHKEGCSLEYVKEYITKLLKDLVPAEKLLINPSGTWTIGGPTADCGLTGRKIVCDQYGGYCAVGGGAFSGKDPSKVDRSATYMARTIAIALVRKFELKTCEVQLGYAIGVAEPVSVIAVDENGKDYSDYVKAHYDLTPRGIIRQLDLYNMDYEKLAEGCHFR